MRSRRLQTLGLLLMVAIAVAACTGGGSNGDGTPSPSPTPLFVPLGCQIVWFNHVTPSPGGIVDFYAVDMPVADWTLGTHLFASGGPRGVFYKDYDLTSGTYSRRALATSGSFVFQAVSTTNGHFIHFTDPEPQAYFEIDTAGNAIAAQGSSGVADFEGLLSDPYAQNVTHGSGTASIVFEGTSSALSEVSYAICYSTAPVVPLRAGGL